MATVINPENPEITISKSEVSQVPECVFWLPCDETGTITALIDAVSGETVTVPSSTASDGGVSISDSPNSAFSGTLPVISNFLRTLGYTGEIMRYLVPNIPR